MSELTLQQRLQKLPPDECYEYLHTFPCLMLEEAEEGNSADLEKHLGENYGFLEAKIYFSHQSGNSATEDLLQLYDRALKAGCDSDLREIQTVIRQSANIIEEDIDQLPSQLFGRLCSLSNRYSALKNSIRPTQKYWIKSLQPILNSDISVITRHSAGSGITSLLVSPDGRKIISSAHDKTIRVYDRQRRGASTLLINQELQERIGDEFLFSHPAAIMGIAVTPDSQLLYSVCRSNIVCVWDLSTYEAIKTFFLYDSPLLGQKPISGIAISSCGDFFYCANTVGDVCEFNAEHGHITERYLSGHDYPIKEIIHDQQEQVLTTVDAGNLVQIWCPSDGNCRRILNHSEHRIQSIALTPDNQAILIVIGKEIRVTDIHTGRVTKVFSNKLLGGNPFSSVAITNDGQKLFAGDDGTVYGWDFQTGEHTYKARIHGRLLINRMYAIPSSNYVVTGDENGNVKLTDFTISSATKTKFHSPFVEAVLVDEDCEYGVSIGQDKTLVWEIRPFPIKIRGSKSYRDLLKDMAVSRDAKNGLLCKEMLLGFSWSDQLGESGVKLVLWNVLTGRVLEAFTPYEPSESITSFCANDSLYFISFATRCSRGYKRASYRLYLFKETKIGIGYERYCLISLPYEVRQIAYTDKTAHMAFIGVRLNPKNPEKFLEIYNWREDRVVCRLHESLTGLKHLKGTRNFDKIIASDQSRILIWDIEKYQLILTIETGADISDLEITRDGNFVISVSINKSLAVWSLDTGVKVAQFLNEENFSCCAASANGRFILTGDLEGNVSGFILMDH